MTKDAAIALALKISKRDKIDMYIVVEGYQDEREWEVAEESDVDTYYNGALAYLVASNCKIVL